METRIKVQFMKKESALTIVFSSCYRRLVVEALILRGYYNFKNVIECGMCVVEARILRG